MNTSTGMAYHPSLDTDGTSLYVGWEEQNAIGQRSLGYVKKWNGSAWSALGGAIAADTTNGSVQDMNLVLVSGTPVAVFEELEFGNLRQIYQKRWNGTAWVGASGAILSCDINGDAAINIVDVQIAINQALGLSSCNTADLLQNGQCSVLDVQRVINASLGAACRIGQ
jgi:hypothetical protein